MSDSQQETFAWRKVGRDHEASLIGLMTSLRNDVGILPRKCRVKSQNARMFKYTIIMRSIAGP